MHTRRRLFSTEKLQFLKRLIILVFHLASLSLAVYFRPADVDAVPLQWPREITDVVRTAAECITVLGVLSYVLVQLGGEMINIGPLSFLKQLVGTDSSRASSLPSLPPHSRLFLPYRATMTISSSRRGDVFYYTGIA